jgi:hypothetical protein
MIEKNFIAEFEKFKGKILSRENFAFSRYADGEYSIMNGFSVGKDTQAYSVDGWSCDGKNYKLSKVLIDSIRHSEENYYYGIVSPCQNHILYNYFYNLIDNKEDNITFSDLWINYNYKKFKHFLYNEISEPVVLFASEKFVSDRCPFAICDYFPIPSDCVNYYELNEDKLLNSLNYFSKYTNTLFLICAGPLSEAIIHNLYINNPNNRYIDAGSAIDEIIHGEKTRPYMLEESFYSNEIVEWS